MEMLQSDGEPYIYLMTSEQVDEQRREFKGCVFDVNSGDQLSSEVLFNPDVVDQKLKVACTGIISNKATNHVVSCFNQKVFVVHSPLTNKFVRVMIPELTSGKVNCPAIQGSKFYFIIKSNVVIEVDSDQLLERTESGDAITLQLAGEQPSGV